MNKIYPMMVLSIFLLIHVSVSNASDTNSTFSFSIIGGPQFGGINEDNDIDAVTSATKAGGKTGIRAELAFRRFLIFEIGLEHIFFNQELSYKDVSENYDGKLKISFQELRIPFTYNFHRRKNRQNDPLFIFRIGPYVGFLIIRSVEIIGSVPDYSTDTIEGGLVLAWTICPFTIGKHISMGIFIDMHRGFSTFWNDPYNDGEGFGVSRTSSMCLGLQLRFCNF